MKKWIAVLCLLLLLVSGLWIALETAQSAARAMLEKQTLHPSSAPTVYMNAIPEETAEQETTQPTAEAGTEEPTQLSLETTAPAAYAFTEEEEQLLLKIGMAERGSTGCTECIALVMRTVLNRVESPKFSATVKGVIYAQDQFTPVMDGSFDQAIPNWRCEKALEMIKQGWDESQGALYYEWCEGESWHSRNLELLLQHCDTRFYH